MNALSGCLYGTFSDSTSSIDMLQQDDSETLKLSSSAVSFLSTDLPSSDGLIESMEEGGQSFTGVPDDSAPDESGWSHRTTRSIGSSKARTSRNLRDVDEDMLHRATADAGLWAMGTVYVEVWVQNESFTQLHRPEGGYWMDPVFHDTSEQIDSHEHCNACSIANPYHATFMPAKPVAPGVGLAGVLWSEAVDVRRTSVVGLQIPPKRKIVWRDLRAMSNNPHLPFDMRLKAIVEAGLGWAAGVPFNINDQKGIVIYMTRSTVDHLKLQESSNELYLQSATDLIGSAWALRGPRNAAMQERRAARDAALHRAKVKLLCLIRMGANLERLTEAPDSSNDITKKLLLGHEKSKSYWKAGQKKAKTLYKESKALVKSTAKKCLGTNNRPPPPFSNSQSIFTFFGSFVSVTILAAISFTFVANFGGEYLMVMPPFGALVALQFGLTQAPAAQPRSCLVGQLLSLSIALTVAAIPGLPIWIKQALATSLAIAVMARCGVLHPPGGAAALVFASGNFGIVHMILVLFGNVVAIVLGAVINNLSQKRQYPTYIAMGLSPKSMIDYLKRE